MTSPNTLQSLCLVRLSALGDVVLVLPLIRHLQRQHPDCKLTWVIGKGVHEAVAGLDAEGVEFIVIDKPRRLTDYMAFRRRLAGRTFDALLCLQASWRANWLYPCISAKRKIGYGKDRAKDLHRLFVTEGLPPAKPHLADGFLQFAEALGLPFPSSIEWRLPVDPAAACWVDAALPKEPYFAFSPCSSKPERDWPADRHAEILRYVHQKYDLPIVVLGGPSPAERAAIDRILALAQVPVFDFAGQTRIQQLIAALARCRLLFAPDTGAVHIANALGRPVVGLYAVAPASRTGPYGNSEFCADHYEEGVRTLLHKNPAETPWAQRVHHPEVMKLIPTAEVVAKIDSILRNAS